MVSEGDTAPTFTATVGTSDHEPFDLADHLGDGPVVLAFFPGAFTPPCRSEMVAFQDHLADFDASRAYDLEIDIADLGLHGIANRAVFVLDADGEVVYAWEADDPTNEPDYDDVLAAVEAA